MHLLPHSLAVACLLSIASQQALAAPSPAPPAVPRTINLTRRTRPALNGTDWLKSQKAKLKTKYGSQSAQQKRAAGINLYVPSTLHCSLLRR